MHMAKKEILYLINQLPDDCTVEDVQYHLYVREKVRRGLDSADAQGAIRDDELDEHLGEWLSD